MKEAFAQLERLREMPGETKSKGVTESEERDITGETDIQMSLAEVLRHVSVRIAEMYSPPTVTPEATQLGHGVGEVKDSVTGWDFLVSLEYADNSKHNFKAASTLCTRSSSLHILLKWAEVGGAEVERGSRAFGVHGECLPGADHGINMAPANLSRICKSLELEIYQPLLVVCVGGGVYRSHTCRPDGGLGPEPSDMMPNSSDVLNNLSRRCNRWHRHQRLPGSGRCAGPSAWGQCCGGGTRT